MNDDVLVRVENVSKRFCRSLKRSLWYGLQDLGSELGGRRHGGGIGLPRSSADVKLRKDEFWAVKDVSFELRRGECLGLIGRNGAGKTTLLRMLNGLIKPDTGRIHVTGKVGALIALGAGFNPLLSGRENIYINSTILGISKREVDNKMDKIVEFAELSDSIDSPVQTYSSGMQVRLGFSVAAVLEPEVLILDEVLAVGDMSFQAKCWNRLGELKRKGSTFIIVSHQMINIDRLATKCLLLKNGCQISDTYEKNEVIQKYEKSMYGSYSKQVNDIGNDCLQTSQLEKAGSGKIRIRSVSITDDSGRPVKVIRGGQTLCISFDLDALHKLPYPIVEFTIRGMSGTIIQSNNKHCTPACSVYGPSSARISIPSFPLCNDALTMSITLWNGDMTELYDWTTGIRIGAISGSGNTGNVISAIIWQNQLSD